MLHYTVVFHAVVSIPMLIFPQEEKPKGVSSLIEVENPNRLVKKSKKVEDLDTGDGKPQLSRKQRYE